MKKSSSRKRHADEESSLSVNNDSCLLLSPVDDGSFCSEISSNASIGCSSLKSQDNKSTNNFTLKFLIYKVNGGECNGCGALRSVRSSLLVLPCKHQEVLREMRKVQPELRNATDPNVKRFECKVQKLCSSANAVLCKFKVDEIRHICLICLVKSQVFSFRVESKNPKFHVNIFIGRIYIGALPPRSRSKRDACTSFTNDRRAISTICKTLDFDCSSQSSINSNSQSILNCETEIGCLNYKCSNKMVGTDHVSSCRCDQTQQTNYCPCHEIATQMTNREEATSSSVNSMSVTKVDCGCGGEQPSSTTTDSVVELTSLDDKQQPPSFELIECEVEKLMIPSDSSTTSAATKRSKENCNSSQVGFKCDESNSLRIALESNVTRTIILSDRGLRIELKRVDEPDKRLPSSQPSFNSRRATASSLETIDNGYFILKRIDKINF